MDAEQVRLLDHVHLDLDAEQEAGEHRQGQDIRNEQCDADHRGRGAGQDRVADQPKGAIGDEDGPIAWRDVRPPGVAHRGLRDHGADDAGDRDHGAKDLDRRLVECLHAVHPQQVRDRSREGQDQAQAGCQPRPHLRRSRRRTGRHGDLARPSVMEVAPEPNHQREPCRQDHQRQDRHRPIA